MKKTVSRFLSVLLVLAMVLSGIPGGFGQALQVYAEGNAASSSAASLYQVEFTRTSNNLSFIFIGTDPVLLSSIFRLTGLRDKKVDEDEVPLFYMEDGTTPDSAFAAVKDGTDWKISYSGAPDESWIRTMTVKVEGTQYTYRMTFAAKSGGTWQNQDNQTMTWAYDSAAHTLTLSGTGRLSKPGQDDDFGLDKTMGGEATWVSEVPWKAWVGDIQKVVIEEGITAIGDQTYRKHAALKSVEIKGNTLTEIGKCAFIRCTNLTTLDLRNCTSLTDLGQNATASEAPFLNSGLTTVLLSPAITSLPKRLFDWSNAKVSKVNLSELVELTSIEEEAFKKEDNSLAITDASGTDDPPVPLNLDNQAKLVTIEKNAFRNQTGLSENLVIASPVLKTIGEGAFSAWKADYGKLTSADLSACAGLETIGKEAFLNQAALATIQFPDAFTWIDKAAFSGCTSLGLSGADVAYCVGGNGALYNVKSDGTAERVLNSGDDLLYWIPTAKGSDPAALAVTIPYTGAEQALVNAPDLRPETGSYSIKYTLNSGSESGSIPEAKDPGTYMVGYTVKLPDGTTIKTGSIAVTIAEPKTITDTMLSLDPASFTFNGSAQAPVLTVKDGSTVLTENTDYTVSGDTSQTDVGFYTISVTGKGGYTGTASVGWTISSKAITDGMLSLDQTSFTFDGAAHTPVLTVEDGSTVLAEGTDYTVSGDTSKTDAGSYTISVIGKGNYIGSISKGWTITSKAITDGMLSLDQTSFTFDGAAHTPVLTVKDGSTVLAEGTDYTVDASSVTSAKDSGSYTISVTGKGNYSGSASIGWAIGSKAMANDMLSLNQASFEYDGSTQTPLLTVKDGSTVLAEGTDYTVSGDTSQTDVGSYTISVTGKGDYTGTASVAWSIADTVKPKITGVENGTEYPGSVSFEVSDLRLASVTLQKDSETAQDLAVSGGKASGTAAEDGAYTLTAKDASGNETTVLFTINVPAPPVVTQADTPVFDPAGTTFRGSLTVTISCATPGATIRYTTDGSDPGAANGEIYTSAAAITLTRTTTLKAIAIASGYTDSEIAEETYRRRSTRRNDEEEIPDDGPPLANPFPFDDVPEGTYFRKAVEWAWEKGVTSGTSEDTFSPYASATRAQAITALWAAAGSPEPTVPANPFKDVAEGDYFYKAVLWAYEKGITSGVSEDVFGVDRNVSRAQFITFLYGAAGRPAAGSEPFDDVEDSVYFRPSVAWAYEKGITSGTGEGHFSPDADCQRCQLITFLYLTYGAE